jgi:ABC-type amino acid transport substrate-binding protein
MLKNRSRYLFNEKRDNFGFKKAWDYREGGLIFYKENREDAELFDKGFRKIYESGRYHEILESFYGKGKVPEDVR